MERWTLPEGWGWKILDKVAPEDGQQIFPTDYPEQVFNYWGLEAIEKNQFDEPQPNFVLGSSIQSTCVKFDNQHVLYCKLRPYLNKVIVPSVSGIGSTEWVPLKPDPNILERKFLAFYLRSPQFLSYSTKNVAGARMPRMSKKALKETSIPIPFLSDPPRSLAEQRRIVARLEALLGEVKAMREQVQIMRRDVNRLMESALAEVFPSVGQPLPEGWEWKDLSHKVHVFAGSSAPQNPKYFENGKYPFVRVSDLSEGKRIKPLLYTRDYVNDTAIQELSLVKAKAGTIVFPKSGAAILTNNRALLGMDAYIVSHLAGIYPDFNVWDSNFIYYWLCTVDLKNYLQNPSYPSLTLTAIKKLPIPLPYPDNHERSLAEQRRIVAYLDSIQEEVREAQKLLEADLRAIEQLEQSILAAAFRGEI